MPVRVVVVEDEVLFRDLLRALLDTVPDVEVVGEAEDGRTALALVKELQPDLLIADVVLPDLNGIDVARTVCTEYPDVKVLVISAHSEQAIVAAAFRAGATGFVSKSCHKDEVLHAIQTVLEGDAYLAPNLAGELMRDLVLAPGAPCASVWTALTGREREVLQLVAEGKPPREIADLLGISAKTVESHREQILSKLGLHNNADLVRYAIREGLTPLEP